MNAGVSRVSRNRAGLCIYERPIGGEFCGHHGSARAVAVAEHHVAAIHTAIAVARGMVVGMPRVRGWGMIGAMTGRSSVLRRMGIRALAIGRGLCRRCRVVDAAESSHRSGVTYRRYRDQQEQGQQFA